MVSEVGPGAPLILYLGGHYAQPGVSAASIPEGQALQRQIFWAGDRNCGAPILDSDLHREVGDYRKHFGEALTPATSGVASTADLAFVKRLQELAQDRLAQFLREHEKTPGTWVRLFSLLARAA